MEVVTTKEAPQAIGPYSQAIVTGDYVFTVGQIALDPETMEVIDGSVAAQTERVLESLAAVLQAAGSGLDKVVKTTVYLAHMAEVYARRFGQHKPARATVQVAALPKGVGVEIDAIALRV